MACLSLIACRSESPAASNSHDHAVAKPPVLQFAEVADAGETQDVQPYDSPDGVVRLKKPRTFTIKTARPDSDANGYPAVWFEVADSEKEMFRRWTAELVDRHLAILVDGKVVTVPKVNSALPGAGIIDFGASHKSEEEVRDIAARIRGESV
jgi:preprotein translocase subunit SecD